MELNDSTERFTTRVDDYRRYRPGYPDAAISTLLESFRAPPTVADIGSGTGIFTNLLLARGCPVYAVEPNASMRAAAEATLGETSGFNSVAGQAEATGLDQAAVDLVTAAQAFHWFHNDRARAEFCRILRADGRLALIWNRRDQDDPFQQAYHVLLERYAPEYGQVDHMSLDDARLAAFYRDDALRIERYAYRQRFDFAGLLGRLNSASYCPPEDSRQYSQLVARLEALFHEHAVDGELDFRYQTCLYIGRLSP